MSAFVTQVLNPSPRIPGTSWQNTNAHAIAGMLEDVSFTVARRHDAKPLSIATRHDDIPFAKPTSPSQQETAMLCPACEVRCAKGGER